MRIASLAPHLALGVLTALACGGRAPEPGGKASPASIEGLVLDAERRPVPAGRVGLIPDPPGAATSLPEAPLNEQGAFALPSLRPGKYVLFAEARGRSPAWVRLEARAGERLKTVLRMDKAHDLEGRVVDQRGQPISFAEVHAEGGQASGRTRLDVMTRAAADGTFKIPGLPSGKYRLAAEAHGLPPAVPFEVDVPSRKVDIPIEAEGRAVVGRVVTQGAPAELAEVFLGGGETPEPRRSITDAEGRFRIDGLPAGRFALRAVRGSLVSRTEVVSVRVSAPAPNVRLDLGPGGFAIGRVVDETGVPFPDTSVAVVGESTEGLPLLGQTDGKGTFSLGPLPPGHHRVEARRTGYLVFEPGRLFVPFGASPPVETTVRLAPAGSLRGVVLDATTDQPLGGVEVVGSFATRSDEGAGLRPVSDALPPAAEAALRASRDPKLPPEELRSVRTRTSVEGRFELAPMPAGPWRLAVRRESHLPAWAGPFNVAVGATAEAGVLKLVPGFACRGRVLDARGKAVEGARVARLADTAGGSATTDGNGAFFLPIPAGPHEITIVAAGFDMAQVIAHGGAASPPEAIVVKLASAATALDGSVKDGTGRVVPRAKVSLTPLPTGAPTEAGVELSPGAPEAGSGALSFGEMLAGADGHFHFRNLPKRPLALEVRHPDFPPRRQVVVPGTPANVVLPSPGAIAGDILEKGSGAFVANYRLSAEGPDGRTVGPSRTAGAAFEIGKLRPGRWTLVVDAPGFRTARTVVDVPPAPTPRDLSVRGLKVEIERL